MKSANKISFGSLLVLLLVWLVVVFIPSKIGLYFFNYISMVKNDKAIVKAKQNLLPEAMKYDYDLDAFKYLSHSLENNTTRSLLIHYLRGDKGYSLKKIRENEIIANLPDLNKNMKSEVARFSLFLQRKVGSRPTALCVLADKPEDCEYYFNKPFKLNYSDEQIRKLLYRANLKIVKPRLAIERKRLKIARDKYAFNMPFINKLLGLLNTFYSGINEIKVRYSIITKNIILCPVYTLVNKNHSAFLFVIYDVNQLRPDLMIKRALAKRKNSVIKQTFGWSNSKTLPYFCETEDAISLFAPLPEKFVKICSRAKFTKKNFRPVIRLTKSKNFNNNFLSSNFLRFAVSLYLLTTILFVFAFAFNKFEFMKLIRRTVLVAFIVGIAFPLTGLIWVGMSYVAIQDDTLGKEQLDYMKNRVMYVETKARVIKNRQNEFVHYFADLIENVSFATRLNAIKYVQDNYKKAKKELQTNFSALYIMNADGQEKMQTFSSSLRLNNRTNIYLKGPIIYALNYLGAYKALSSEKRNRILQTADLSLAMLENVVTSDFIGLYLARAGDFMSKNYTIDKGEISLFLHRTRDLKPDGISCFNFNNGIWIKEMKKQMIKNNLDYKFYNKGFETAIYIFGIHQTQVRTLSNMRIYPRRLKYISGNIDIKKLADSLFSRSDSEFLDNLDHKNNPHLIVTEYIPDLQAFILAYSVPVPGWKRKHVIVYFLILVLSLLLSVVVLSSGISGILSSNIPVFSKAINLAKENDYRWRLDVSSGDEFEQLSLAFNGMAKKMLERQKLGELVSQNVIDTISSSGEKSLKPGGKKVVASILFSDIRGFTTISEEHSPDDVVEMLNSYFTKMSDVIENHGGIIDKFIGDAIQAVFYNEEGKSSALRATKASLEMLIALDEFNKERKKTNRFLIKNGIGITTGEIISGCVGTEEGKLDATIIGNKLTQAMELEALSKYSKNKPILIDEKTASIVSDKFSCDEFSNHENKLPINIFEIV